ncbi:hypothetical protein DMH04_42740 [Kibdelosporangium aridum]|uniref:Hemopexin n=2 Tax=Kibdelosporangium aridum TaxID=2030 RepID=A0A428YSZ1_KIBAR|nr:hypothetical protein DMH04_42740 [Kibdelosporangium aridum]
MLAVAAVFGLVTPAAEARSAFRGFDAVATAVEPNGSWKHLALRGDQYVIFSDSGIFEGPAYIRHKWPFLPAHFTADVDAASVVRENNRWKYMFTQGTDRLIFFDTGIVEGPQFYPGKWPFLGAELYNGFDAVTAHMEGQSWIHLATAGENYAFFTDGRLIAGPGLIRNRWPWLPQQFMSYLDDAAVEVEQGRYKISFYKGAERLIFSDSRGIEELVDIRHKWPFLSAWLGA